MQPAVIEPAVIERWHRLVERNDMAALDELLADDAVFQSPIVHTPQAGKAITAKYLMGAASILNNASFRYVNEWYGERSAVLEFEAVVDGIQVNGVDMIAWNDDERIVRFKVMVRPLKAIHLLHQKMAALLTAAAPTATGAAAP
ncbi:MAG: hypothetical protein DCC71_09085 [Proteobacteria bacterium]|nr:MAG: hypothetical protein DCC71_09085 [Pseudomonadota bacterium]